MKPRVAFVAVVPSPYQRDLFRALARRVALSVFYLEPAAPDSPWPRKTLEAYERILPGTWFPLGAARCHVNWRLPRARDFDLVVLNSLMSFTAQMLMRTSLRRRPWMFWGERLGGRESAWHRALIAPLHRAAGIVGIGSRARDDYRARFPESRHFCIPYCCELEAFQNTPRPPRVSEETVFLFCGQMIARKGVDTLLAAFARVPNARLLLVGRQEELPETLPPQVEYAGFQAPEALPEFFARADVFVLPSRYDGWGVVVNQALGAGLPVICSDAVGAGWDLVEPEMNGLRFPAGDVGALAAAMQRTCDPALRARWSAESRQRAAAVTPERGAELWESAIAEVLAA